MPRVDGSTLKMVALVTMLIDHVGAGILLFVIRAGVYPFGGTFKASAEVYEWIRHIGRQAFPIYCFLLTEGLIHTRSIPKYIRNLAIFGIISEPFFDLALKIKYEPFTRDIFTVYAANKSILLHCRNVYVTLLTGLLVIWTMKLVEDSFGGPLYFIDGSDERNPFLALLYFIPAAAGALLAQYINSDYRWWGVVLIAIFFVFRNNRLLACFLGYIFFMNLGTEEWSLPAFLLIMLYNGKPGKINRKFKYVFYAFYPVHLALIYFSRTVLLTGILPQG
ncbi:TraX family protein [Butyrivibrio sp. VCD2006]|uniref:TraX family protein n=1 Tax=Butyrivibrio sp. VCD2006 TaxID=1280664 RepID=UPI0012DC521B|nr:TraX family protein [Butyrivibrio sp. VCD2006]